MIANRNFENCEPLTWIGRMPVYLATALAGVHAIAMILTAFGQALAQNWFFETFAFSPAQALDQLHLWQFVTYAFVNPPGIFAALQIILLAIFGREVEKFIGRRSFAWMYALLVLATPIYLSALSLIGMGRPFMGSSEVQFAVFIAFAWIYPRAEIFFSIQARWIAIGLLTVYTLQLIAGSDLVGLGVFWLACGVATTWLTWEGVGPWKFTSPLAALRERWARRKFKVVPKEPTSRRRSTQATSKATRSEPEDDFQHDSIDPILEKIARQGIGSLTKTEREKLEKARVALLDKERTNR